MDPNSNTTETKNRQTAEIIDRIKTFYDAKESDRAFAVRCGPDKAEKLKKKKAALFELAAFLDVNKATVYHWENGGQILRHRDREKVRLFLGSDQQWSL